jgi:hypothetical protein
MRGVIDDWHVGYGICGTCGWRILTETVARNSDPNRKGAKFVEVGGIYGGSEGMSPPPAEEITLGERKKGVVVPLHRKRGR